jgi:glycosyltransferase involved in cell wall biosynthesis
LKILFLVTEDWYFWSHRLRLAQAARSAGAEILIMTHVGQLRAAMEEAGFQVVPWNISRHSLNPLRELDALFQVVRVYRRERPDLLHHVALKPIFFGGVAARLCGGIASVNAIAGLGHVFTSSLWSMHLLRTVLSKLLRVALKGTNAKSVFENEDNRSLLVQKGIVSMDQSVVIRGTGVNTEEFSPRPEPTGIPVVMLASRMLWEKGVGEFVTAARMLRGQGLLARFVLVGRPDPENPSSIPDGQLGRWQDSGLVEYWGHRDGMAAVLAQSNVVCLPSYLEGLPRVLIEAAACGRAIVTTDVPGCREVVRHNDNGLLVPPRDSDALASALANLIRNPHLRSTMGARGRHVVVREFSEEVVFPQFMAIYRDLLGSQRPGTFQLMHGEVQIASESCVHDKTAHSEGGSELQQGSSPF